MIEDDEAGEPWKRGGVVVGPPRGLKADLGSDLSLSAHAPEPMS